MRDPASLFLALSRDGARGSGGPCDYGIGLYRASSLSRRAQLGHFLRRWRRDASFRPGSEGYHDLRWGLVPVFSILGHHLVNNRSQGFGNLRPQLLQWGRCLGQVREQFLRNGFYFEGGVAGEQEVKRRSEAVDVRSGVHVMTVQRLLG